MARHTVLLVGVLAALGLVAVAVGLMPDEESGGPRADPDRQGSLQSLAGAHMGPIEAAEETSFSRRREAAPATITYTGRVSFAGEVESTRASGSLLVALEGQEGRTAPFRIPVTQGSWTVESATHPILQLYSGALDGAQVWPVHPELELMAGTPLVVTVDSRPFVWVVDSESRKPIDAVELLFQPPHPEPWHAGLLPHPGSFGDGRVFERRANPVPTDSLASPGVTLFTAEGHAWGSICLARGGRTPAVVALEPAGTLRLVVPEQAERLSSECWLRLFPAERSSRSRPLYSIPFTEVRSEYALHQVREGDYIAEITRNPDTCVDTVLFSSALRVDRNQVSTLQVRFEGPSEEPGPTPVSFLLVGEDDILAEVTSLSIRPVRVSSPAEVGQARVGVPGDVARTGGGVLEFEPRDLRSGSYQIEVRPLGHIEVVTIPPGGNDEIHLCEIHLAPMADYTLDVRESRSGLPVDVWACAVLSTARPDLDFGALPPGGKSITFEAGLGSFRAERGRLRIWLSAEGYGNRYYEFDGQSRRDFQIVLERAAVVRLRVQSRGAPLLLPSVWWTGIQSTSRSGERARSYLEFPGTAVPGWYSEVQWTPEDSGSFVLEMPPPPGRTDPLRLELEAVSGGAVAVIDVDSGILLE